MGSYRPTYIKGMQTGLVQERQNFILPDDAYPVLENAYVWRERIKRKQGSSLLGRLRRVLTAQALGNADGAGNFTGNLRTIFSLQVNAEIQPGSVVVRDAGSVHVFSDNSLGVLVGVPSGSGTINYSTTAIIITGATPGSALTIAFNYYPELPVMGIRTREISTLNNEMTVVWDTRYAYRFVGGGYQEFVPGTVWTGSDSDFFWTTNYWQSPPPANNRLFWATNFSGPLGDPIRYTDSAGSGSVWIDFAPIIDAAGNRLEQCLAMLPYRARMVVFNTYEGMSLAASVPYPQRIRWSAIGNPISDTSAIFPGGTVNANAWRQDIRGQGGYLDIPTTEEIISVGFVRDNLVIYCERSTWQLRYTGRTISPFQIEKVNSELGAESTFSVIQFDTSLVGIGDKGVVECDSFKSQRIDIKIPDLVFSFNNENAGPERVCGIRDFVNRLAYWMYPYDTGTGTDITYPNRRLVYNYENDSWAIFNDSFTSIGTFQPQTGITWQNAHLSWQNAKFPWASRNPLIPTIIAGNQQGYVEYLNAQVTNDVSLSIHNITGQTSLPTIINSPNHNLETGQIISIRDIPAATPFANLNNGKFYVQYIDANNFYLYVYNPVTDDFLTPQTDPPGVYIGGGQIAIRDNFTIESKKFNFADQGQNIQMGYLDILMDKTDDGAISLKVYLNYSQSQAINLPPENSDPDSFFNVAIPTTNSNLTSLAGTKYWQRVYCPVRGNFITIVYTLSNAQMVGNEQESDVQIDSQILWTRPAGRLSNF